MSQDYKTLRVPEDDYELAKDAKRDDETWGEYLRRCSENPPTIREFVEAEDLDKLRESVEDVPTRTADHLEGRFR